MSRYTVGFVTSVQCGSHGGTIPHMMQLMLKEGQTLEDAVEENEIDIVSVFSVIEGHPKDHFVVNEDWRKLK